MTTIKELITRLQTYNPELFVFVADWSEAYSPPSSDAIESITVEFTKEWGNVLVIGGTD